ncbi:MAG TPA: hypothetical protein VFE60_00925 [Roseiarcus sp.]|nr:hypothetical protein [Roseiarcus sp.]
MSVKRPMLVVVLKDWVTETKETSRVSNASTSLAKSAGTRQMNAPHTSGTLDMRKPKRGAL